MGPQLKLLLQKVIQAFQDGDHYGADSILKGVLQSDLNSADTIFEFGIAFAQANRLAEASTVFCCLQPYKNDDPRIPYNLGLIYSLQGMHQFALESYDLALTIQPNDAETLVNKSSTCNDIKNYMLALGVVERAITLNPHIPEAWFNKGIALENLNRHEHAIDAYSEVIRLNPDLDWVYGCFLVSRMKVCSWKDFPANLDHIVTRALAGEKVVRPFELLSMIDDGALQKKSSEIYIQSNFPTNPTLGPILKRSENKKIRVAYFSADFRNHPVGFLIAELIEIHDRSKFEFYAFSLVKADDEMRDRFAQAFDYFLDVEAKLDIEIAQLARDLEIDIAIDLTGFTRDSRMGIFAFRVAPIQINYLGYPGTIGAEYMDYIIADKTLIPPQFEKFYSEKIVYLPNSYQVNDRKRNVSDRRYSRRELGLPESGFVFCCFNNNFKILPKTFDGWMRILKEVEGSVLWLLADNPSAQSNLKIEAHKRGIDPSRLIFAERVTLTDHLARHQQADLFLDTLPYNAHTTASDALWAGLPVLTLIGEAFASRVAASLLKAIGLPELITNTQEEYEDLAIELANNPNRLEEMKLKLANNRLTTPLFDTPIFAKHLEYAYIKMYERYQADLEPDHIRIA
jgi:protein O-GlcNAc transferase